MAKKKAKKKTRGSDAPSAAATKQPSARARRQQTRARQKRRNQLIQLGAVLGVIAVALVFAFWPRPAAQPVSAQRLALEPALGSADAPVVVTEFADFGCPSCRAWHQSGIKERILERFDGQVRFEWRDFPVITALSPHAAEAGQCAFDQGADAFWRFHDLVYQRGDIRDAALKAYAAEVGLDTATFGACLDSGQHRATVERDLNEARGLRLRGTPSFVVNGRVLPGPPSFEQLSAVIEAALTASSN